MCKSSKHLTSSIMNSSFMYDYPMLLILAFREDITKQD